MQLISKESIEKAKNNVALIRATCLQIQKDFRLFDEEIIIQVDSTEPYQEMYEQIMPIIDRLLNLDSARFFSLLYAIDIPEQDVRAIIFDSRGEDAAKELTHLIIQRELLKVLIRKHFSAK